MTSKKGYISVPIPDIAIQFNDNSFELSKWFKKISSKLETLDNRFDSLQNWRYLSQMLRQIERIHVFKTLQRNMTAKRNKIHFQNNWIEIILKLKHKITIEKLKNEKRKYDEIAEIHQKGLKDLWISFSKRIKIQNIVNIHESFYPSHAKKLQKKAKSQKHEFYKEKWNSFRYRFVKQTMYNTLVEEQRLLIARQNIFRVDAQARWINFAVEISRITTKKNIERTSKRYIKAVNDWDKLIGEITHKNSLQRIKNEYKLYSNLKFKNPDEIKTLWKKMYTHQIVRSRALQSIKESYAKAVISRFFHRVIMIKRASKIALDFKLIWRKPIKEIIKRDVMQSAKVIKRNIFKRNEQIASNFAENFSEAIAEASSSVAIYHLGRPEREPIKTITVTKHVTLIDGPRKTQKIQPRLQKHDKVQKEEGLFNKQFENVLISSELDLSSSSDEEFGSNIDPKIDNLQEPVSITIDNNSDFGEEEEEREPILRPVEEKNVDFGIQNEIPAEKPLQISKPVYEAIEPVEKPLEMVFERIDDVSPALPKPLPKRAETATQRSASSSSVASTSHRKIKQKESSIPDTMEIINMFNSGSDLEELEGSDAIDDDFYFETTGSPIKKATARASETSNVTSGGVPASITSISDIRSTSPTHKSATSPSSNETQTSGSMQSKKPVSAVNLLYTHNADVKFSTPSILSVQFQPYQISTSSDEEEPSFDFEVGETNTTINKSESKVPFDFESDNAISGNTSTAQFVFESDKTMSRVQSKSDVPFDFESERNLSRERTASNAQFSFESDHQEEEDNDLSNKPSTSVIDFVWENDEEEAVYEEPSSPSKPKINVGHYSPKPKQKPKEEESSEEYEEDEYEESESEQEKEEAANKKEDDNLSPEKSSEIPKENSGTESSSRIFSFHDSSISMPPTEHSEPKITPTIVIPKEEETDEYSSEYEEDYEEEEDEPEESTPQSTAKESFDAKKLVKVSDSSYSDDPLINVKDPNPQSDSSYDCDEIRKSDRSDAIANISNIIGESPSHPYQNSSVSVGISSGTPASKSQFSYDEDEGLISDKDDDIIVSEGGQPVDEDYDDVVNFSFSQSKSNEASSLILEEDGYEGSGFFLTGI